MRRRLAARRLVRERVRLANALVAARRWPAAWRRPHEHSEQIGVALAQLAFEAADQLLELRHRQLVVELDSQGCDHLVGATAGSSGCFRRRARADPEARSRASTG